MSRERVERKIERMLGEREPAEPIEGLLERIQAEIPPLDKIGAAHLRAALDQRRVYRLPVLWLTAASAAFLLVGGSLAFRLWQHETTLGREAAPLASKSAAEAPFADAKGADPRGTDPGGAVAVPSSALPPQASPLAIPEALPAPIPAAEPVPGGVEGGVAGGTAGGVMARWAAPQPPSEVSRDAAAGLDAYAEGEGPEKDPAARDPWKTLATKPGVLADRMNVGGNESGQQSVFVPGEAPDSPSAPPPPGPPPALAEERRASRAPRAAEEAKPERQQAPLAATRGMNSAPPVPRREADSAAAAESQAEPAETDFALRASAREGVRFEAALLPWRRSSSSRVVIGAVPGSPSRPNAKKDAAKEKGERGPQAQPAPALALRFEPTAVLRARWLGEEAWRLPGSWEDLAEREAAGRTSRLEVELRPGLKSGQVVAYVRFLESVRALRMAEMARSWEGASWDLQAGVLRFELAAAIANGGAQFSQAERSALLDRARDAEAARPEDPRARQLADLIRRFEDEVDRP